MITKIASVFLMITCVVSYIPSKSTSFYPKCCGDNDHLFQNSSGFYCSENKNKTLFLHVPDMENDVLENCSSICIDHYNNELIKVFCSETNKTEAHKLDNIFHKCCPLRSDFDINEHKCVYRPNSDYLDANGTYIFQVGLGKCENRAVKNYVFDNLNEIKLNNVTKQLTLSRTKYDFENYCIDRTTEDKFVARVCHDVNVCNINSLKCVRKCCLDGWTFDFSTKKCSPTYSHGLQLRNYTKINVKNEDNIAIIQGLKCQKNPDNNYNYNIDKRGVLHIEEYGEMNTYQPHEPKYCIEKVLSKGAEKYLIFFCNSQGRETKFKVSRVLLILSCIFLGLTLACYIILHENLNLYRKTLLAYCTTLLVGFLLLVVPQFNWIIPGTTGCQIIGFAILFTFLAAFIWLNIMCFDIWWTFGTIKAPGINQIKKDKKRFIYYCLYAFFVPTLWTGMTFLFQQTNLIPESLKPLIGETRCFLEKTNNGIYLFHVLPITIITLCNLVLFIRTIYYCINVKNEINKMMDDRKRKSFMVDKERLSMLFKFFIIMGVSFIFEVITSIFDFDKQPVLYYLQYLFDIINNLQGLSIFIVSVVQKKTIEALKKKLGVDATRRTSQMTSTVLTASTSLLTRVSSNDRKISTVNSTVIN